MKNECKEFKLIIYEDIIILLMLLNKLLIT